MRRRVLPHLLPPVVAFILAAVTSGVSAELGVANIAIALSVLTTLAGVLSWPTGLATSIVAALSLNYFHTRPVHSLRIGSDSDILMVTLLGGVGILVSVATAMRTRWQVLRLENSARMESAELLEEMLLRATPAASVWHAAIDASDHAVRLTTIRLEPRSGFADDVPIVARPTRSIPDQSEARSTVLLPERGALVDFRDPRLLQRLRITPASGAGPLLVDRGTLFQLVEAVETVLTRSSNGTKPETAD